MASHNNSWYLDFANPSEALSQALIKEANITQDFYKDVFELVNIEMSMFRYENIDKDKFPNLTSDIIESALMFRNNLCFVEVTGLNGWYLGYWCSLSERNEYYKPYGKVEVRGFNGISFGTYDYNDLILVKDNVLDFIPFLHVINYIHRIMYCEQKVDSMLAVATLPVGVIGDKKAANALKQNAQKLGIANPFIVGDDTLIDQVKSFDIKMMISPIEVYDLKKRYKNEFLTSIGIYVTEDKKERVIVSEMASQNDLADTNYLNKKLPRQRWIDELNAKAGTNIKLTEVYKLNFKDTVMEAEAMARAEAIKSNGNGGNVNERRNDNDKGK